MTEQRYKFATDDDCHNYLIPVELYPLFIQLLENGEADCYASFCNKFDEYRVDGVYHYTFEKPEFTLK